MSSIGRFCFLRDIWSTRAQGPTCNSAHPAKKNKFRNDFKIRGKRTVSKMKTQNEKMQIKWKTFLTCTFLGHLGTCNITPPLTVWGVQLLLTFVNHLECSLYKCKFQRIGCECRAPYAPLSMNECINVGTAAASSSVGLWSNTIQSEQTHQVMHLADVIERCGHRITQLDPCDRPTVFEILSSKIELQGAMLRFAAGHNGENVSGL